MTRKTTAQKLQATTRYSHEEAPRHHFFVSSAATWRVGYDLAELITALKRENYPFNVWLVPGPKDADYEVHCYAPQVEGAVFLSFYGFGVV